MRSRCAKASHFSFGVTVTRPGDRRPLSIEGNGADELDGAVAIQGGTPGAATNWELDDAAGKHIQVIRPIRDKVKGRIQRVVDELQRE